MIVYDPFHIFLFTYLVFSHSMDKNLVIPNQGIANKCLLDQLAFNHRNHIIVPYL